MICNTTKVVSREDNGDWHGKLLFLSRRSRAGRQVESQRGGVVVCGP